MTAADLIATEDEIRSLWEAGEINSLLHLEGSVDESFEQWLVDFFHSNVRPGDWILASHRCHFVYQLWLSTNGTSVDRARQNLVTHVLGGRSMFLYCSRFLCSAIVAGTASIAAGLALSIQRRNETERVFCFIGDGAEDEGHFYESVRLVHARKLPCHFIITDNNSSCGVTKEQRGSPDDWTWPDCVTRIRYTAKYPHAGSAVRPMLKRQTP